MGRVQIVRGAIALHTYSGDYDYSDLQTAVALIELYIYVTKVIPNRLTNPSKPRM